MSTANSLDSQYQFALTMLTQAIELCPEPVWLADWGASPNRFWHIVYHALFCTHMYLASEYAAFVAWEHHRDEYQFLSVVPWRPEAPHRPHHPYSKSEMLEYAAFCRLHATQQTASFDLAAPSGFHWVNGDALDVHMYNLRHLSHHIGQLAERLRAQAGIGLPWKM